MQIQNYILLIEAGLLFALAFLYAFCESVTIKFLTPILFKKKAV